MDKDMKRWKKEMSQELEKFNNQASIIADYWDRMDNNTHVKLALNYPSCMPEFDEFRIQLEKWVNTCQDTLIVLNKDEVMTGLNNARLELDAHDCTNAYKNDIKALDVAIDFINNNMVGN